MLGANPPTPSRGILLPIDDVTGIAVVCVSACVVEALLYMCPLDAIMQQGSFRIVRYGHLARPPGGICTEASWSCHVVPPAFADAVERMRDMELSSCCTAACSMSARASLRRLRPAGVEVCRGDEFLAGPFQVQRVVDVVVGQDPLLGDTPRRPSSRTTSGALLLEHGAQLPCLPTLLLELGLKLLELRQLRLPRSRACGSGWVCCRHYRLVCRWVFLAVFAVTGRVIDNPIRQLNHEALPSGIIIPSLESLEQVRQYSAAA